MVMGSFKNLWVFNFVNLLKLRKFDAHKMCVFYNRCKQLAQGCYAASSWWELNPQPIDRKSNTLPRVMPLSHIVCYEWISTRDGNWTKQRMFEFGSVIVIVRVRFEFDWWVVHTSQFTSTFHNFGFDSVTSETARSLEKSCAHFFRLLHIIVRYFRNSSFSSVSGCILLWRYYQTLILAICSVMLQNVYLVMSTLTLVKTAN